MNNGSDRKNSLAGLIRLAMVAVLVTACSSNNNQGFSVLPSPQSNPPMAPLSGVSGEYLIQPGDRLSVNVLGQDQLSREFPVDANGTVKLPSIDPVLASGRSVTDLQGEPIGRNSATVSDPQILVSVLNAAK